MSSNCQRCAKPVHPAEKIGNERAYHKKCFTCTTCRKSLVACSFVEIGASVYCSPCSTKAAPAPIKSTAAGPSKWTPRPSLVSIPDSAPLPSEVLAAPAVTVTKPATSNDDEEIPMTVSQRRASIGAALGSMPQLSGGFRPPVRRLSEVAPAPTEPIVSPAPQLRIALPFAVKRVEAPIVSATVSPPSPAATSEAAAKPAAATLSHATLSRPVIGHHRRRSSHVPPASTVTSAPSELKFETVSIAEEPEPVTTPSVAVTSAAPAVSIPIAPNAPIKPVGASDISVAAPVQTAPHSAPFNEVRSEPEEPKESVQPKESDQPKESEQLKLEQPERSTQTAVSAPADDVKVIAPEPTIEKPVVPAQSPAAPTKVTEQTATPQIESAPAPIVVKPVAVPESVPEVPAPRQAEPVATVSSAVVATKSTESKPSTAAAVGKTCLHCGATAQMGAFCACGEPLPVPRSRAGSTSGSISLGQNVSLLSAAISTSTNSSVNTSRKSSLAPGSDALAAALAVSASTPSTVNATRTMFQTQAAVTATRLSFSGALPRTSSMSAPSAPVDPNRCVKCNKMAYAAEKMQGTSRTHHKACFKCSACSKSLSSASNGFDRDGQVFCKSCYK